MIECVEALNDQGRDEGIFHSAFNSAFDPTRALPGERGFQTLHHRDWACVSQRRVREQGKVNCSALFCVNTHQVYCQVVEFASLPWSVSFNLQVEAFLWRAAQGQGTFSRRRCPFRGELFKEWTYLDNGPPGGTCVATIKACRNSSSRTHVRFIYDIKGKVNLNKWIAAPPRCPVKTGYLYYL